MHTHTFMHTHTHGTYNSLSNREDVLCGKLKEKNKYKPCGSLLWYSLSCQKLQLQGGLRFSLRALRWHRHGRRWENYKLKQLYVCPAVDTEVQGLVHDFSSHHER